VNDDAGGVHIDDFFAALQGVSGVGETPARPATSSARRVRASSTA